LPQRIIPNKKERKRLISPFYLSLLEWRLHNTVMRRQKLIVLTLVLLIFFLLIPGACCLLFPQAVPLSAPLGLPISQQAPLHEQWLAIGSFFGIKTIYTLLNLWLLWRLRQRAAEDLAALWWGLLAFFIGEAFCFINVMWFGDLSIALEWLHGTGMVVFLACVTYAGIRTLDLRVLHLDAHSLDLRSIKRSCVHIVAPASAYTPIRLIPFDTYNLLYRGTPAPAMR